MGKSGKESSLGRVKDSGAYRLFTICNIAFMLLIIAVTLYPFLTIVAKSFSSESAIMSGQVGIWPKGFNTLTYRFLMSDSIFWQNYKNTVVYTITGTVISLVLTTVTAYVLSKKKLMWRNLLLFYVVITMYVQGGTDSQLCAGYQSGT